MENGEGYKILTRIRFKKLTNQIGRILRLKNCESEKDLVTCSASQPPKTNGKKGECCSLLKIRGNLHSQIDYYGIYLMNGKSYDLVHAFNEKTSPDHHPKEPFFLSVFRLGP